jgi:CheY-like chemotaxis protein
VLTGQALVLKGLHAGGLSRWAEQLDRAARQHRLEDAALVAQRLAHDFGNVLTAVVGFSELSLGLLGPDAPCRPYAVEIHRAAQQGADLTRRLRWFSRRSTSRQGRSPLAEVTAQEEVRLRLVCGETLLLRLAVPPDLPPVACDADSLRTLLGAVLDNAREASPPGGAITLSARLAELCPADCFDLLGDPAPGAHVEVTVADEGAGLSTEVRQRLFAEPFLTTKPRHRGLGLAVVYGILRCHRGGLRMDPGHARGTVVRLYLPVAARCAATASPTAPPALSRGERLLVVDDDVMVLSVVCTALERAGYRIQGASSAAGALACYAAAGADPFHLVVSDVLMPQMNGVELARRLLGRHPGANLLFMSAQVSADFSQASLTGGPFEVLAKPFHPDTLLRAVRTALDRCASPAPPTARGPGAELPLSPSQSGPCAAPPAPGIPE